MSRNVSKYRYLLHCRIVKRVSVTTIRTQIYDFRCILLTGFLLDTSSYSRADASTIKAILLDRTVDLIKVPPSQYLFRLVFRVKFLSSILVGQFILLLLFSHDNYDLAEIRYRSTKDNWETGGNSRYFLVDPDDRYSWHWSDWKHC